MKDLLLTAALVLALLFGAQQCSTKRELQATTESFNHAHDSATVFKTRAGVMGARNVILMGRVNQLLAVDSRGDKLLAKMQAATDKYTEAAAAFAISKEGTAAGTTTRIVYLPQPAPQVGDTARVRPPLPNYYGTATSDGFTADIKAGPDSMQVLKYVVTQELAVNFTTTGKGLFKKREHTVEVTATSPGGKVLDVRAFQVPTQPPQRGVWFALGFAAGFLGQPFITRSK